MRPENAAMVAYLAAHDLPEVKAKFIRHGSLAGCWRLSRPEWTPELRAKLDALGFTDFDGFPLTARNWDKSMDIFARGHPELA